MTKGGWVYMMANRYRGTIYTGVTADLAARVYGAAMHPELVRHNQVDNQRAPILPN